MNTSTHPVAQVEVMALLDGELPAAQTKSVSDHLQHCADCSSLAAQLGEAKRQLVNWQVESLPSTVESKISEATEKLSPQTQGLASILIRQFHSLLGLRSILALCGVIFAALLLSRSGRSPRDSVFERHVAKGSSWQSAARKSAPSDTAAVRGAYNEPLDGKPQNRLDVSPMDITPNKQTARTYSNELAWSTSDKSSEEEKPEPPAPTPIHQPMIARSVSLTIVTKNFASSRSSLEAILARHHGYAAQLSASTAENAQRSITASLRVPANELAAALVELKTLGHVETESQAGEEVTQQHADLLARLKNSRETEQRLQAILLQRTGKIADVLAVEEEISRVRGEIEEMEAEQKSLEHRVDFATIELRISEEFKAQLDNSSPSASTRIHNSLVAGYKNAAETLLGFVLFFAESGPTLLIWLVILLVPAWLLVRRFRRAAAAA